MKGALVFELDVKGQAGHSAYPESGHSATHHLVNDLKNLLEHPWPKDATFGQSTLNVGRLNGGVAGNVIAPSAHADLVLRATTEIGPLENLVRSKLNPNTQMQVKSRTPPAKLHVVPGIETTVVAFGSDVPYLSALGTTLLIGPGSILDAHTADEKIRIADLERAVAVYQELCEKLLDEKP
jgi:acetylornithine deacetylase